MLNRKLDKVNFPDGSPERLEKIRKVSDYLVKLAFYLTTSICLYKLMKDSNFMHWSVGGSVEKVEYFDNFPC